MWHNPLLLDHQSSKFGFVSVFWIWIVVFAERAKRAERTRKLLGFFEVRSYFLDLVCCFCRASGANGAYSKTFGFVRILGFFEVWVCSYFFGLIFFAGWAKRAKPTRKLLGLFEFWVYSKFGFISIFWIWFVVFAFSGRIIYVYSSDIRTKSQSLVKKYIFCLYSCLKTIVFKLLVGFWICSFYWLIFLLYVMCYFLVFFSPYFFDTCYSDMWPSLPYLYKVVSKFVNNSRGHF